MTFAEPWLLLTLAVVPLVVLAYVLAARRSRGRAAAAAAPGLWPNLMPRRPGWRRHVAPVLTALAIALLLVGLARPQMALSQDRIETTVVLTIDASRSMAATDVQPSRIEAARSAARELLSGLPDTAKVGVVSFSREVRVLAAPTDDRQAVEDALAGVTLSGGTALGDAITRAVASLRDARAPAQGRAIVVISDGKSTEGATAPLAAARAAKAAGVRIFAVSLGTASGSIQQGSKQVAVPPDPATLQRIASLTGGRFYRAADAAALRAAYRQIGGAVRPGRKRQDVSFAFVAGAGALAVGGSLLSLVWFRRLI